MDHGLKRLVLGSAAFLPIPEAKYTAIADARMVIREALYIEQKFDFIVENYIEFEEALIKSGIQNMILGGQDYTWFRINRALFDRRIMNLLTTAIAYSDSVEQHLNRMFSRDIEKVNPAMAGYSAQYDSRIGYRTMCKLRNFIQHQGLPVHGTAYHSQWIERDGVRKAVMRNTVDPYLSPDELRDGKFNRTILAELEAIGDKIDLKSMVRDYIEGLSIAHGGVRQHISALTDSSLVVLEEAIQSFEQAFPQEGSIVGLAAVKRKPGPCYEEDLAILREPNEHRLYLETKNPTLVNLRRRYASSEVVEK